jgi:hypothetical protein
VIWSLPANLVPEGCSFLWAWCKGFTQITYC